jgi:hypothetical protein
MIKPEHDNPNLAGIATRAGWTRWPRVVGNFGSGFIFIGALMNLALFMVVLVFGIELQYLYKPWWLTYLLLCCVAGWTWRFHGNRHLAEA